MYLKNGSNPAGTRLIVLAAGIISVFAGTQAIGETVKTVNGIAIDSAVLDFYLESRTQRPAEQVTAEEREILLTELTDIYLLSTQASAKTIVEEPAIKAQLELQRRGVIAQAVASEFFSSSAISEDEILAEYDAQVAVAPPLQFKARHILLETQGAAVSVIGELDMGGNFEALAKEHSTGPSGPNGGDLGWFSSNQMVKPFSDAVAALEDGKYTSQPVQTEFGWHVILREDSRESEAPTLDSVREVILQNLQQRKFQTYLDKLRADAKS